MHLLHASDTHDHIMPFLTTKMLTLRRIQYHPLQRLNNAHTSRAHLLHPPFISTLNIPYLSSSLEPWSYPIYTIFSLSLSLSVLYAIWSILVLLSLLICLFCDSCFIVFLPYSRSDMGLDAFNQLIQFYHFETSMHDSSQSSLVQLLQINELNSFL
eukprot:102160_1